jgi:7,8-dihydro-6-hydroxymethylpterin-pyrophosphokinase
LTQYYLYVYAGAAFIAGFITAWIIRSLALAKTRKLQKSAEGYLESEKLMKETLQKENTQLHKMKQAVELEYAKKLKEARDLNRMLDQDILLLQKSNEETEALLQTGQPALHDLKLKLIEAYNTIARYKAQSEVKESN